MYRFVIISTAMICLSVAGAYSLSVSHAAFSQVGDATPSASLAASRDDVDLANDTAPQLAAPEVVIESNIPADLVLVEYREDFYTPETGPKPRPERDRSDSSDIDSPVFVPSLSAPIRADISRKYRLNLANRIYVPEQRSLRAPQPSRDSMRINPIPGYLIGVFR